VQRHQTPTRKADFAPLYINLQKIQFDAVHFY